MIQTMKANLAQLIESTKGKFFSVTFIKNDGSERVANGKDFYSHLQRGGENKVAKAGYTSFYDRNAGHWVCAKGERVKHFKCGAIEQTFSV